MPEKVIRILRFAEPNLIDNEGLIDQHAARFHPILHLGHKRPLEIVETNDEIISLFVKIGYVYQVFHSSLDGDIFLSGTRQGFFYGFMRGIHTFHLKSHFG